MHISGFYTLFCCLQGISSLMSPSSSSSAQKKREPHQEQHKFQTEDRLKQEATDLRERLVYLCTDLAPSRGIYDYLAERTAIGASKWKNVFLRRQMPTIEMLVAICQYRGEYAHWLLTGKTLDEQSPIPVAAPTAQEWAEFLDHRQWMQERKGNDAKKDE